MSFNDKMAKLNLQIPINYINFVTINEHQHIQQV